MVVPTNMLEVKNVGMVYPGGVRALDDVSFEVRKGEFVSITGPTGCGKSTVLKIIGDLIEATEGRVKVNGMDAHKARLKGMFSFDFQNPVLLPWRTVLENVALSLEIMHNEARDPRELLRMFGLRGFEDRYPSELSGGMKQRVALARALTFNPQVLLMDEPFGAVDELNRAVLNLDLLRIWQEIGVTILFVTHSISEAVFLSDRVFVFSARPARLKDIVPVTFPRPREKSLQETEPFQAIVKSLREKLE